MTGVPGNATVLDAIVLSKFVRVDAVELLLELPRVVTVDEVATELERGRDAYLDHAIAILGEEITVVESAQSARKMVQGLLKTLDPGEQQAVAVAEAVDRTVVTDDGGRAVMGCHGTVRDGPNTLKTAVFGLMRLGQSPPPQ
jgi:predicted nucleic acid-binding protein